MSGFTKGPWSVGKKTGTLVFTGSDGGMGDFICEVCGEDDTPREVNKANARLIASAPELLEALKQTISLAWQDSREVAFDSTVMFGVGYDFDGWDLSRSEIHTPAGSWAVWRSGGKYSVYGGPDGGMWFEKFDSREDAEEVALREIDRLCPSFPTAIARAAISRATGEGE